MSLKENISNLQNAISSLQSKAADIYEAGYQAGRAEGGVIIDPDKVIEKTVTGTAIRVDDVSEIPHKCTVSVNKDTNVTIYGKNLYNFKSGVKNIDFLFRDGTKGDYRGYEVILPPGTYTFHAEPVGAVTESYLYGSVVDSENNAVYNANGERISINLVANKAVKAITIELLQGQRACLYHGYKRESGITEQKANDLFNRWNVQVEVGMTATAYEPYNCILQSTTITAGGNILVDSVCSAMSVLTDNGATITFNYNKSWGMQAEYDRFWDSAQLSGTLTNYNGFFAGKAWTAENMKPKYDVKPINAQYMFAYCGYPGDLDEVFEKRGLSFDLSEATYVTYLFYMASITSIGTLDCSGSTETTINSLLNAPNLETIRCFIPPAKAALSSTTFSSGSVLKNIIFGGEIKKSINFSRCTKLSAESVQSAIDHLADLTDTTTQTLTFASAIGSTLTEEQKAAITAKNWTLAY